MSLNSFPSLKHLLDSSAPDFNKLFKLLIKEKQDIDEQGLEHHLKCIKNTTGYEKLKNIQFYKNF